MPGWHSLHLSGDRIVERARAVPRAVIAVAVLAVLIVVSNEFVDVLRPGSDRFTQVLSEWLLMPTIVLAVVALWMAVQGTEGDERLCWMFIFLGMCADLAAELIWGPTLIFGGKQLNLSAADVFWLTSYPLWFAGLYVLDRGRRVRADAQEGLLDALIVMAGVAILMWELVVQRLVNDQLGTLELIVNFAYVAGDLGLFWFVVRPVFRYQVRWDAARSLLAGGMLAFAAADLVFILPLTVEYGLIGTWAYVAIGGAGIAAALASHTPDLPAADSRQPRIVEAMPLLTGAAVAGLLIYMEASGAAPLSLVVGVLVVLMLASIRLALTVRQNRSLLKDAEERAVTDALTGLRNHRYFHERLEVELARARRHDERLGLLIVDVDRLKQVNDSAGHRTGDALLRSIAAAIRSACRATDTACRIGGDEMAVITPNVATDGIRHLGERVVEAVRGLKVYRNDGVPGLVTASISAGGCAFPDAAPTKDALIERADGALYHAKRSGRDRMVSYDPREVVVLSSEEELERAQEQVRVRDAQYDSVINTMMEGVVLLDSECFIRASNDAAASILGVTADELYGVSALDPRLRAVREDGSRLPKEQFPPVITARTGESLTDRIIGFRTAEGELRWLMGNSQPVTERAGENGGFAVLATFIDITERKWAEEQLAHVIYHDELTGLANINLFRERLELATGPRRMHPVAVLWAGLDDFGLINESLGSKCGDELLRAVGARLSTALATEALVARHSGDEFLVLLEDLSAEQPEDEAKSWASHIHMALREPFSIGGEELTIGASIGASLLPGDARDATSLLEHADRAMYRSKRKGPGGTQVFSGEEHESADTLALTTRLRKAVDLGNFVLYYQPIIDLKAARQATGAGGDYLTESIVGAEALIRWQDPQSGLVLPGEFIPLAERAGLIEPIGDWVMDEVFRQQSRWRERGFDLTIGFNLSPQELRRPDLSERVLAKAAAAGADPRTLMIEITENAVIANLAVAKQAIEKLGSHGIGFAIDDFGTGFSTLGRLKEIPVRVVKVDAAFLQGVPHDPNASAMLAGILQIASGVGRSALAEGIETREQQEFAVAHGCRYGQGYFFSRPLPAVEFVALLEGRVVGVRSLEDAPGAPPEFA